MQTRKTLSRREALRSGLAAMGAVGIGGLISSRGVWAAGTIKAGYMSSVTDNDKSWGQSQLEVLGRVSREYQPGGASVEFIRSFGVPPPDYAEQADKLYSLGVRTIFVLDEGRGPELYRAGVKRSDLYIAESGTGLEDTTPPGDDGTSQEYGRDGHWPRVCPAALRVRCPRRQDVEGQQGRFHRRESRFRVSCERATRSWPG